MPYQARVDQAQALGLFLAFLTSGGGGGGGGPASRPDDYITTHRPGSPSYSPAPSTPPISSFYGSCHNPMGC